MPALIEEKRKLPIDACRFDAGRMTFAEEQGDNPREAVIKMLARTPLPITHWYWGKITHDMKGMKLRKDVAPIDWCHETRWHADSIGYADSFDADEKNGLTVKGKLLSVKEDDQAAGVIARGRGGVPYESSIDWSGPMRLEEIGEGMKAEVNGYTFEGPGVIVREWTLCGIAVCPFGADPHTRSQFSDKRSPEEIEVTIFSESPMKTENATSATEIKPVEPAVPVSATVATPAPAPVTPAAPQVDAEAVKSQAFEDATKRASEIMAWCKMAGKLDQAQAFIADPNVTPQAVQEKLFKELCAANAAVGANDGGEAGKLEGAADENKKFKDEYKSNPEFKKVGMSEEDYVFSRRVDEGLETIAL